MEPADCVTPRIVPINMRSPDIDRSLAVDLVDLSIFAAHYPPGPYDACSDFDLSGDVNVVFIFALGPSTGSGRTEYSPPVRGGHLPFVVSLSNHILDR